MMMDWIHRVNGMLHTNEPIASLCDAIYWWVVLAVLSPLAGVALAASTVRRLLRFPRNADSNDQRVDATGSADAELAVFVTGCDSGFGRDIALELASADHGFVVFASCLTPDGVRSFDGVERVIPLRMNVTSDDDVSKAVCSVSDWISRKDTEETNGKPRRFLHALINNAGVGCFGLVDWVDLSMYQRDMEVNYFGMIRTSKAFLPILKSQAVEGTYENKSRIVNVVSMAGLTVGVSGSSYHGSKFAAEAFSACLRVELEAFNVAVVTVNPSFHETPIVDSCQKNLESVWRSLDPGVQEEYGVEFLQVIVRSFNKVLNLVTWKPSNVLDGLVYSVEAKCPNPQVLVGTDAKYSLTLWRMMPLWFHLCTFKFATHFMRDQKNSDMKL